VTLFFYTDGFSAKIRDIYPVLKNLTTDARTDLVIVRSSLHRNKVFLWKCFSGKLPHTLADYSIVRFDKVIQKQIKKN